MSLRPDVFGYYDDPCSDTPAHDPGMDGKCAACGKALDRPVVTISVARLKGDRSYFFRSHKACWESLSEEDQGLIESVAIDDEAPPLYPHDCDRCVFLGRWNDPDDGMCDLYVCKCGCGCDRVTLLSRTGPNDYYTWLANWSSEGSGVLSIREACRRAAARQLFGLTLPGSAIGD
jgi:hypothetical protein